LGVAGIAAAALVIGVVNNVTAGPERRLEWSRDYPPKKIKPCSLRTAEEDAAIVAEQQAIAGGASATMTTTSTTSTSTTITTTLAVTATTGATGATTTPAATAPSAATTAPAGPAGPTAEPATVAIPDVPPGVEWLELAPDQVRALFDQGAIFVDARLSAQYREGHVKGAISIPIWEAGVDEKVTELPFATQGDMSKPIVVYCGGGDCEDSHTLGSKLFQSGFTRVYVYKDGFPNWSRSGWPVSTGEAP